MDLSFYVECPNCDGKIAVSDQSYVYSGQTFVCPECGAELEIRIEKK